MSKTLAKIASLDTRLRERIKCEGPITFCDWMSAALYDPDEGYYCRDHSPWGREGDYRTSPERSPLFAAVFARYFAGLYEQLGRPATWTIFEAGAGAGHFAAGLLDTLQKSFADVFAATSYVLDEPSPYSRARAQALLQPFSDRIHFRSLDDVDTDPGIVFSNELLDAFPVHRITFQGGEFKEFYVTVGESGNFKWTLDSLSPTMEPWLAGYFEALGVQPEQGQVIEVNLGIEVWLQKVAKRLRKGYVVTVDYGADAADLYSRREGTLRGFQQHQFVDDLLAHSGDHDLTTTVDWNFVKSVGTRAGLEFVSLSRLDRFLLDNGFLEQLELKSQHAEDEGQRLQLTSAAREMVLPDGMAASFQVLVQKKKV